MAKLTGLRLRELGIGLKADDHAGIMRDAMEGLVEPGPGVPPCTATVYAARLDGYDILVDCDLDPLEYFAQCHALDMDDLETLADLKAAGLSQPDIAALVEQLKDAELTKAWLDSGGSGLTADSWPSQPEI